MTPPLLRVSVRVSMPAIRLAAFVWAAASFRARLALPLRPKSLKPLNGLTQRRMTDRSMPRTELGGLRVRERLRTPWSETFTRDRNERRGTGTAARPSLTWSGDLNLVRSSALDG